MFQYSNEPRQDFGHFQTAGGHTLGFQCYHRGDSQLQRIKEQGVTSHFLAQRRKLVSWLSGRQLQHAIVVRIFDDTNVWVAPHKRVVPESGPDAAPHDGPQNSEGSDEDAQGPCKQRRKGTCGRQGKRKVCPLLGIIQRIFARTLPNEAAGHGQSRLKAVQVPSQVLPKAGCWNVTCVLWSVGPHCGVGSRLLLLLAPGKQANTQTIYQRLQRWSCLTPGQHSQQMGGQELQNAWSLLRFKILATCCFEALALVLCETYVRLQGPRLLRLDMISW